MLRKPDPQETGSSKEVSATPLADAEKLTFVDLAQLVRDDYEAHGRTSFDRLEISLARLDKAFGNTRPIDIRPSDLTALERAMETN